jgi:hypothetical protein
MNKTESPSKRAAVPEQVMMQEAAQLVVDMLNVEAALRRRGDHDSIMLAASLAAYRRRLEKKSNFVRIRPEPEMSCLKHIVIEQGKGWLKLIDTRGKD